MFVENIGLVARDLNLDVEDPSCVILAHELAHAFTHVGSDANHLSWESAQFQSSALEVREGLLYLNGARQEVLL